MIFHDCGHRSVRNQVRPGMSAHVAMTISDHRTTFVFDRCDIVNDQGCKLAAQRPGEFPDCLDARSLCTITRICQGKRAAVECNLLK